MHLSMVKSRLFTATRSQFHERYVYNIDFIQENLENILENYLDGAIFIIYYSNYCTTHNMF